jgi:thiamine biosynthesis lipoprotein
MGTDFTLAMYASDAAQAELAARAAFDRVSRIDQACSDYKADSEVRQLGDAKPGEWTAIGPDLSAVLRHAQRIGDETDGAFDVTVGPYVLLWRQARHRGTLPPERHLKMAAERVGQAKLQTDWLESKTRLMAPGMRIDLGGIAKGYAVDAALYELWKRGISRALVNGGGDVAAGREPPGKTGWRVQLSSVPGVEELPALLLKNAAVATSGDLAQFVEIDGVRYSHIIDPRTGIGLTNRSQVSVIAGNCTDADALASAVSVLGPEKGLALIERRDNAEAYVVRTGQTFVVIHQSSTFDDYLFR